MDRWTEGLYALAREVDAFGAEQLVELMQAALAGQDAAMGRFAPWLMVETHRNVARILSRHAPGHRSIRQDVDDCSSQILAWLAGAGWNPLRRFDAKRGKLRGWLYAITLNKLRDWLASRKKNPWTEDATDPFSMPAAHSHSDAVSRMEARCLVKAVFDRIDADLQDQPARREHFTRLAWGDNHRVVAAEAGIAPDTLRKQWQRYRERRLAQLLDDASRARDARTMEVARG